MTLPSNLHVVHPGRCLERCMCWVCTGEAWSGTPTQGGRVAYTGVYYPPTLPREAYMEVLPLLLAPVGGIYGGYTPLPSPCGRHIWEIIPLLALVGGI